MDLKAPFPNSNPVVQASHLSGFKFSTIGQGPSLLERMSDSPRVPPPQSSQNPSQEQQNASPTRLRPLLLQPLVFGASSVELGGLANPIPTQRANALIPTSTLLSPSVPPNNVEPPQPADQIRASVFPDLQYPNVTPDVESPVLWDSHIALPQPAPMDQDAPHSQDRKSVV